MKTIRILFCLAIVFSFSAVLTAHAATNASATVNWTDVHQKIDGFGTGLDWVTILTDAQADAFFSVDKGIGLSLLRNTINPDGTTDHLSVMKQAQARGVTVWSTPFSPPAAWKTNGKTCCGGYLQTSRYQDYADQLAAYVANMKANGVSIYAVSLQNEPDVQETYYDNCLWTGQNIHDFVPYLYSALAAKGVSNTKIILPEQGWWTLELADDVMNDQNTAGMVGILAAHAYWSDPWVLDSYGKPLWQSEVCSFGDTFDPSMPNAMTWAANIHQYMTIPEVNSWNYYALMGSDDNEAIADYLGNPAKRGYVLGQYSKFVRPGYYRIGATVTGSVFVSAYKDPASGNFAIVATNTNSTSQNTTFSLKGFSPAYVTPWITSSVYSLAQQSNISVTGQAFSYTLPASSVVTFVGSSVLPDTTSTTTTTTRTSTTTTSSTTSTNRITTTSSSTTSTTIGIPGDADGNGHADYYDLIILAASYDRQTGESGFDTRADFNSDGIIGYDDLIVLAVNYGS